VTGKISAKIGSEGTVVSYSSYSSRSFYIMALELTTTAAGILDEAGNIS
jgi:hypothetical protein